MLARAASEQVPIYSVDHETVDELVPLLELPQRVRDDIRQAAMSGATVVVPRVPVTIGGWKGTGYVVRSGTASDHRISGGLSGGIWEPVPIPGVPTAPTQVLVTVFDKWLGLNDRVASCLLVFLDIAGLLKAASILTSTLVVIAASAAFGPLGIVLALVAAVQAILASLLFVYAGIMLWNDTEACIEPQPDGN